MAEVFPQTSFWLFFDVPLSSTYENTFYFANATEQQNYFLTTFSNIVFSAQSYQRKSRGRIRVKASYGQVYNANYMAFVNMNPVHTVGVAPAYEQKRYYCFVDDVEYVNDAVCDIYYTVDVLQSFMFDWQFEHTFVERLTTPTDVIGEHIEDEGLPVGDYINNSSKEILFSSGNFTQQPLSLIYFVVAATITIDYKDISDSVSTNSSVNGLPNGCLFHQFNTAAAVKSWLDSCPGEKLSAIIAIAIVPFIIAAEYHLSPNPSTKSFRFTSSDQKSTYQSDAHALDGYIPRNKKLQCYPYNLMMVQGGNGDSQEFAYEFFGTVINFTLDAILGLPSQAMLYPTAYKSASGVTYQNRLSYAMYMPISGQCTWNSDSFKAWYAMNSGYMYTDLAAHALNAVGTVAAGAYGFQQLSGDVMGGAYRLADSQYFTQERADAYYQSAEAKVKQLNTKVASGLVGDIQAVANDVIKYQNAKKLPDSFNGSSSNQLIFAAGFCGFQMVNRCVRSDYAKILDDYFTMFGYRVSRVMVPNIHARTRFTYLKTSNMDIKGRIPTVYKNQICSIFNMGIRWWVDRAHIGDYSYINAPLQ